MESLQNAARGIGLTVEGVIDEYGGRGGAGILVLGIGHAPMSIVNKVTGQLKLL